MITISKKKLFQDYGIFMIFLTGMFLALLVITLLSRKSWIEGLKKQVATVLEETYPGKYTVGDYVSFNSALNVSASCYHLNSSLTAGTLPESYVLIIRIMTIYGPMPAVYICNKNGSVDFIGFTCISRDMSDQIKSVSMNSTIQYWKLRIRYMLLNSEFGKSQRGY
jgi:hypothetical protein